jgi:hypothetical protein
MPKHWSREVKMLPGFFIQNGEITVFWTFLYTAKFKKGIQEGALTRITL